MPQAGGGICFCRMPSDGNIDPPTSQGEVLHTLLYRLPQYKHLQKVKEDYSEKITGLDSVCICHASSATAIWQITRVPQWSLSEWKFFSPDLSLAYKKMLNNRPLENPLTARKTLQGHLMTVLQFQHWHVRKTQFQLPLVLLNLLMVNLSSLNLTMHRILTVKRKVLMTLRLLWLQLVNQKDILFT